MSGAQLYLLGIGAPQAAAIVQSITDIVPPRAPVASSLVLTGVGFSSSGNSVTIGGVIATITAENSTEITVTIPTLPNGQADIIVTKSDLSLIYAPNGVLIYPEITSDPIEERIKNEIGSLMASEMTISNGYRFDMGDINEYVEPLTSTYPTTLVIPDDEINNDQQSGRNAYLYDNEMAFYIVGKLKNDGVVDAQDSFLEVAKLIEDYKRFFGNHYQLADAGALNIYYGGHKKLYSNNATYPVGVSYKILVDYRQYRNQPEKAG